MNEKTNGKPEIWLYFRAVPDDMLADPGEQLKKVLSFRSSIEKGKIFFEKKARLYTPDTEKFDGGKEVSGWVEIPKDKPGLWSFESIDAGIVKTENLPGFFSFADPNFYMEYTEK